MKPGIFFSERLDLSRREQPLERSLSPFPVECSLL
jgi:hypothetical protein